MLLVLVSKSETHLFIPFLPSGWNLRCMDSGNMHHFVGADAFCISWGHAQYGELGYGPEGQKYVLLLIITAFFFSLSPYILFI